MPEQKIEKWITWAERVIALLKPKFHNAITKTVVIFGLTLSVESQVNILEAFAVAGYESLFGSSEYLRGLFSGNSNPWIGVVFVIFGLVYNAVVTIGLELIQKYKEAVPQLPTFRLEILNCDDEIINESYQMRGKTCVHSIKSIPDNSSYSEYAAKKMRSSFGESALFSARSVSTLDPQVNKEFYRDREHFLLVWGGAEIMRLKIENSGSTLARNVRVVFIVEKKTGVTATNDNNLYPNLPNQETENTLHKLHLPNMSVQTYDVKNSNTTSEYLFEWDIGHLQAKESRRAKTDIYFRTESNVGIAVKVYCDELPDPIVKNFSISPPVENHIFDMDTLKLSDKEFINTIDSSIMDGYLDRHLTKLIKEYEAQENELLPK